MTLFVIGNGHLWGLVTPLSVILTAAHTLFCLGQPALKPFFRKGHLHVYRFCDEVWTFIVDKPTFRFENETIQSPNKIKVVACTAKAPAAVPVKSEVKSEVKTERS